MSNSSEADWHHTQIIPANIEELRIRITQETLCICTIVHIASALTNKKVEFSYLY